MILAQSDGAGGGIPRWLLELLSVDPERLRGGTEHFRFARFPEGAAGLLAILAILIGLGFILWNYGREGSLSRPRKILLAGLRSTLLAGIALVIFYPVLEVDRSQEVRASTILLLDASLSQGIRDRYHGSPARRDAIAAALGIDPAEVSAATRHDLARRAVDRDGGRFLRDLAARNRLEAYAFSGLPLEPLARVEPAARGAPEAPLSLGAVEPRGRVTDISGAIRAAVDAEAGGKVAAIVLISDGRVTAGEDLKGAAAFLRERDIPVHAVGAGDPTPVRNFRVATVLASERVFAGDPAVVDVRIEARGLEGETARVELIDVFEPDGESPRTPVVLESREVTFPPERSEAMTSFRFEPGEPGRHRITARVESRPDETFTDDNERSASIEVTREASRVLLVAGGPSFEYRFLKNLLRRDSRIFLAGWLMSADPDYPQEGKVSLKKLPDSGKDLFAYDVVVLNDIDLAGLPPGFPALLEEFVGKHRGGLAYIAGSVNTSAFLATEESAPIRNMLPVSGFHAEAGGFGSEAPVHDKEWPLEPTPAALDHPAARLSSQIDRNREIWAEIAGVYWSFPVDRAKPAATALFVHPDPSLSRDGKPRSLVAVQHYEGGRVLWCGIDSTWRWRSTAEEVYDQFWIQSIRWLTESRLLGNRRTLLETDREAYDLGESFRISARLEDESYKPLEDEEHPVRIEAPDGSTTDVALRKDPALPGWFRGAYAPRMLGPHRLRLASGVEKSVSVDPPALELAEPRLDEEALRELAASTGGSYSPLHEIAAIPERIADRRQTITATDEPIPLWDNALALALLAGLLTVEWILRKWSRLL